MNRIRFLTGALLAVFAGSSFALVPADIPGVPKDLRVGPPKAVVEKNQNLRKRALAATQPAITTDQLFGWAEASFPDFFPKGPQSFPVTFQGTVYVAVRAYANGNYLGVTDKGMVRALFVGGQLIDVAPLVDFTCQVLPAACGGVETRPGTYRIDFATHVLSPNYKNGKATWLGAADGKSYDVAPGDIAATRFNSNRRGWGAGSQASTAPQPDGTLAVTGTCHDDRGLPTVITKDGKELYPDLSDQGYQLVGEASPRMVLGMIEYGGYQPARVSALRETDNTVTVEVDFTTNCVFGFGKNNALVPLDAAQPLMFMWHGAAAGAGRKPGWGLGTAAPSVHQAFFDGEEAKKGRLLVRFTNMACSDRGGITVYQAKSVSADGKTVVYDPTADNFGAGWLVVPNDGNPIWQSGQGVTFDGVKFQISWDIPLCTQK